MEVGWIATSTRSYGSRTGSAPSISSSPLFARVAESTVIFGPICQVGCESASVGCYVFELRAVAPSERRPPDAVRTIESTVPRRRPSRHWKGAECSLSTGRRSPPPAPARPGQGRRPRPGSPCSRARGDAALERPQRRGKPGEADDRVEDDVRVRALEQLGQVAADLGHRCEARRSAGIPRPRRRAPARAGGDHLDRLTSDRPGGAQHRDPFHLRSVRPVLAARIGNYAKRPER